MFVRTIKVRGVPAWITYCEQLTATFECPAVIRADEVARSPRLFADQCRAPVRARVQHSMDFPGHISRNYDRLRSDYHGFEIARLGDLTLMTHEYPRSIKYSLEFVLEYFFAAVGICHDAEIIYLLINHLAVRSIRDFLIHLEPF